MTNGLLAPGSRVRWRDPSTGLFRWGRIVDATETTIDVDVVEAGREPIRIRKNLVHGHAYGWGPMRRYQVPPDNVPSLQPFETAVADGKERAMSITNTTEQKTTETKAATKKAAKAKAAPKAKSAPKAKVAKAPKEPKAKKDGPPPGNRTFAVRITDQELAAIHKAAGPRGASRLARHVLAAFAAADVDAFKGVIAEAAANRKG